MNRSLGLRIGGVALVALLAAVGVGLARGAISPPGSPEKTATGGQDPATDVVSGGQAEEDPPPPAEGFAQYRSPSNGFVISYPQDWQLLRHRDAQVEFVAAPNDTESISVRVSPFPFEVKPEDVASLRPFTDESIGEEVDVLVKGQPVQLGGLPGLYYLYRFDDPASDQLGVHAHYFLFDGDQLYAIVFQTIPEDDFEKYAPTFDKIAESFALTRS